MDERVRLLQRDIDEHRRQIGLLVDELGFRIQPRNLAGRARHRAQLQVNAWRSRMLGPRTGGEPAMAAAVGRNPMLAATIAVLLGLWIGRQMFRSGQLSD